MEFSQTKRMDPRNDTEHLVLIHELKDLSQKVRGCVSWQQTTSVVQVRDLILSDACSPTPSYKMFIWTHAMNPKLLRRLVWAWS